MVTVIEGCDQFCTFCVVPYTRGRERSRPAARILRQVHRLVEAGLRDVELLGQTINAYRCPETGADLADLLHEVARVPGLARLRFITSHPRYFTDRLISAFAQKEILSKYLHLPFQSGSDEVLRRMHRRYTRSEYLELVERIRAAAPDVNLSTDVIVGFPGETERDFEDTVRVLEEIRFGQVFGFAYSPRPRTPAARYALQVGEDSKRKRLQRLFAVSDRIVEELNRELVGSVARVLIDGTSRRSGNDWQGRGEDNRVVNFPRTPSSRIGDIVHVRILRAGRHSLSGEIVTNDRTLPIHPVAPPAS
jgi:tRNA-2-methylthio-N6-dimethylallyladenosine synthase